jgi:glycosyltransferase involved in cell wall biosynthesis
MSLFTILIPTHDHADTLWYSVQSTLNQTIQDLEVIVVGDGAPERTAEIMAALSQKDARVRYMPFAKGERHGELSRHEALQTAKGQFVCYQADDDLWLPDHLEVIGRLLASNDLAHTMTLELSPDGSVSTRLFDVDIDPAGRNRMRQSLDGFGLASGGHTIEAYRRLPNGWRPAPLGINTDLYFWLQFLDQRDFKYASYKWPTTVHLSSVTRANWSIDQRLAELSAVASMVSDARWREDIVRRALLPVHEGLMRGGIRPLDSNVSWAFASYTAFGPNWHGQDFEEVEKYCLGDVVRFDLDATPSRSSVNIFPAGGLYEAEAWGAWLRVESIALVLPIEPIGEDLILSVEMVHFVWPGSREISEVSVSVNGSKIVDIVEKEAGVKRYEGVIPASIHRNSPFLTFQFLAPNSISPASAGANLDQRPLSAALVSLSLSARRDISRSGGAELDHIDGPRVK